MISRDKNNSSIRYMFSVKSSLAPEGSTIAFSFDQKTGLRWIGQCQVDKTQIEDCEIDDSKKALARRIVLEMLCDQDIYSRDILDKLKLMGMSERTINTAKKELGVTSYRKDGAWFWHLDDRSGP